MSIFDTTNGQANTNIFADLEARKQQQTSGQNMPPAGATDFVPSNSVPGQQVPGTPYNGQHGQMGHRVNQPADQSPLAGYVDQKYASNAGQEGGQQSPKGPESSSQQPPANPHPFSAGFQDFESVVGQQNFIKPEDKELLDKATKGDGTAMMQLLNTVAQRSAAASAFLSTQVTKQGVTMELDQFGTKLPDHLSQREFATMFDGPQVGVLSNPKVAALAPSVAEQFRKQYPKAPAAEIKKAVERYLADTTGYKPEAEQKTEAAKAAGTNWTDGFFSVDR